MIQRGDDLTTDQLRDLIQDAHLNFLLGAGASMPFFSLLGDIENLLTSIEAAPADAEVKRFTRARVYASFFREVIAKNQSLLKRSDGSGTIIDSYQAFLQTLNRLLLRRRSAILNKQVNLFTTNIDLTIELASEALQLELNDGFSGRFRPRFSTSNFGSVISRRSLQYDNLSEIPTFNLLKLHGSVSWRTLEVSHPGGGTRSEIRFDGRLSRIARTANALEPLSEQLPPLTSETALTDLLDEVPDPTPDVSNFLDNYDELAIVNPTKAKFQQTVLNQNYYDLLRLFSNELEKENTVLFLVGFSCRDEHIRELMVRAARVNPTLQVVIFAHSAGSADDIEKEFSGQPITNGNIRIVEPPVPKDGEQPVRFDLTTINTLFFEPLVPQPTRPAAAQVDINVSMRPPLVPGDD
ncbi:hypothetical protein EI067_02820 [Mycobacterium paragordonae]|uniref:SIR2 family protein n=1 Tax=Mycobacterium paragordonae TaxID=1389713 RepID=UPI00106106D1|nr:SIR2 family protein [Mycobacterium paragordonae]TDL01960.1 hypothetical protein EI067_02820 [Mycobacterium paragordonae]